MDTTRSNSPYSPAFAVVMAVSGVLAVAVLLTEAARLVRQHALLANGQTIVLGLMLVSLATVMLSMIVPDRIGRALLVVGAMTFLICVPLALAQSGHA